MRGLAKINRGLLLTLLAAAGVVIYILVVTAQQAAAKPDIERVCKSYVAAATQAAMLPENARVQKPGLTASGLDTCIADAKKSLSPFYPDGSKQLPFVLRDLETSLKTQAEGEDVILGYTKSITKFSSFTFSGASVTVAFECDASLRRAVSGVAAGTTSDTLTLQKINGSWKVVYASLSEPTSGAPDKTAAGLANAG